VCDVPRRRGLLENVTRANLFYVATVTFGDGSRGASRGSSVICVVRKKGRVVCLKMCSDYLGVDGGLDFQRQRNSSRV
jgi:hypothetical protein